MASIGKNPRGTGWQARWRDPGGRQRKKNFTRKVDAQRWLDDADFEDGHHLLPHGADVFTERLQKELPRLLARSASTPRPEAPAKSD